MEPASNLNQHLVDAEANNDQLDRRRAAIRTLGTLAAAPNVKWLTKPFAAWRTAKARATLTAIAANPTSEYLPVREEALIALSKNTKTQTSRAIHQIAQNADNPEQLRVVAVALLGIRNDRTVNRLIISLAGSSMSDVATQAVKSLDVTNRRNRNVILHTARTSRSPQAQIAAIERLAEHPGRKTVRTLIDIATTTDLKRRSTAINALADSAQKTASKALAGIARDDQQPNGLRRQAISGLANPHHHDTALNVLPALVVNEAVLQSSAVNALRSHDTPQAHKKIAKLIKDHPDLSERYGLGNHGAQLPTVDTKPEQQPPVKDADKQLSRKRPSTKRTQTASQPARALS